MTIKYFDIKEFVEDGYLQEINRRYLHPLGIALEVKINDEGKYELGGIWDYRNEEEGILFSNPDFVEQSKQRKLKFNKFNKFLILKRKQRKNKLGFFIQKIK